MRRAIKLSGAALIFNDGSVTNSTQTIPDGEYLIGTTEPGYPDLVTALTDAATAAYVALFGGGEVTVTWDAANRALGWQVTTPSGGLDELVILWAVSGSTLDPLQLGFEAATYTIPLLAPLVGGGVLTEWTPGVVTADDTCDKIRHTIGRSGPGPMGLESYLPHTDTRNPPSRRLIVWDRIEAARMTVAAVGHSYLADRAGVDVGDASVTLEMAVILAILEEHRTWWVVDDAGVSEGPYTANMPRAAREGTIEDRAKRTDIDWPTYTLEWELIRVPS